MAFHSAFVPSRHNGWQPSHAGVVRKDRVHNQNDAKSVPSLLQRAIRRALSILTISVFYKRKRLEMLGCKPDRQKALEAVAMRHKRKAAAERGHLHRQQKEAAERRAHRLNMFAGIQSGVKA